MKKSELVAQGAGLAAAGLIGAIVAILLNTGQMQLDLRKIDWNAIAAVATAIATAVALWSSWNAIRLPEKERARERRAATREVLRGARGAIVLFRVALKVYGGQTWKSVIARRLRAKALHLHATIDRLLTKPNLSDGAISTGIGAMQILKEVEEASDIFFERDGIDFGTRAQAHLEPIVPLVKLVRLRYKKVKAYSDKHAEGSPRIRGI